MAVSNSARRAGLAVMSALPLAVAGLGALLLARDAMELTSAAIAVGAALSLASLIQLSALVRETRRLGERQDEMRAQALALARCMRTLNARMSELEDARAVRGALSAEDVARPGPSPPPEPLPEVAAGRRQLRSVAEGAVWGTEFLPLADDPADGDAALCLRIVRALSTPAPEGEGLLVRAALPPSVLPGARALALHMAAARSSSGPGFVLAFDQSSIKAPGEGRLLAELAQAGVRLGLAAAFDADLDGQALKACNFVCVIAADPSAGADLARRLAAAGVTLVRPFDAQDNHARCAGADAPPALIPWRALPAPAPRRRRILAPLLSRAS